jgi:small ligand-binding sensory domain FIST
MFACALAEGVPDGIGLAERCLGQLDRRGAATLGFVYGTDMLAAQFEAVVDRLRRGTGIDTWVGTVGMGVMAGAHAAFGTPALAVMTAALPAGSTRLIEPAAGLPADLAAWSAARGGGVAVVHGDARDGDLADRLDDLSGRAGCFVVGGLGSSRVRLRHCAGGVGTGPLSGLVLAPELVAAVGLTQGCSPLGTGRHLISKAEGGLIEKLDDRPALEVLQLALERMPAPERARAARRLHAALPIAGRGESDYLVRDLVGVDPANGTIAIAGEAEPGRELIFVRRDLEGATADLRRMASRTRAAAPTARAAIYFSCVARGPHLFPGLDGELGILRAAIGDIPVAGLFCDGEIFDGRLYGYTGVLALLA